MQGTTCIIVLNIDDTNLGIIVDPVQQVIDIDKAQISPDSDGKSSGTDQWDDLAERTLQLLFLITNSLPGLTDPYIFSIHKKESDQC